jgi:L-lactate dehydrogenase (cytochrome)
LPFLQDFLDRHPGGPDIILSNASKDVTRLFKPIHPPGTLQANEGQPEGITKVGRVPALAPSEAEGQLSDEERSIKEARENMPHIDEMVNLDDFEKVCKAILTKKAWACASSFPL